ncbi:UvrD-helicase domain-containing protein [Feifania hominis]|uniref:DNA 3'-5' helicase n=1 Tax=Feifania hominis TaxID=2763660 RepID=A0A926DBY0_9FIRM|nr:UvrD-helicase domain-containing protein [Feifania hominis]MBC8536140.1 UvrD-helicase domain-containing protein [Feifania hominis]
MTYIADLHIHSKYSRATSRDCDCEHLDLWARRKGIALLGTGDFTHPAWRQELAEKLAPAEDGLYVLREEYVLPDAAARGDRPRFVVSGEISSIYKRDGKTRKVHNVILLPGLEAAEKLALRLEAIGNIHSDGRPILGLDSRDLLEITLEACPQAVFIPAHIWTPHFSMFGAFSGFDTVEACFGDLAGHIHAVETGLSSDPPMNWRLSALDRFTLVSNSDAHSPAKLGREANRIEGEMSYDGLARALCEGAAGGFRGTIEFFPEEGKYHLDGHRNCGVCLTPAETAAQDGRCPVCGRKLTIGVLHRVEELADRPEGYRPANALPFESLAPLQETLAASLGIAPAGKRAAQLYEELLQTLGPEFVILRETPLADIEHAAGACVAEGIRRLRAGEVMRRAGFDGEYGGIELFTPAQRERFAGQVTLFGPDDGTVAQKPQKKSVKKAAEISEELTPPVSFGLNVEQRAAVEASQRTVAVIAGPGTGKTRTLVSRVVHLIRECGVKPAHITAVTFTNKAAAELRERLEQELGRAGTRGMTIGTFHSICLALLSESGPVTLLDEPTARQLAQTAAQECGCSDKPERVLRAVSRRKSGLDAGDELSDEVFERYCELVRQRGARDFDDLLVDGLRYSETAAPKVRRRFDHLLVDEFQDIDELQYRLTRTWSAQGESLFVIGDPDQSIYGFRGSDSRCFAHLQADEPDTRVIRLVQNYRSTPEILRCALPVISRNEGGERVLEPVRACGAAVRFLTAPGELSAAIALSKEIARMTGGIDMVTSANRSGAVYSFADIAVLYRTHRQSEILEQCLQKEGIPFVVTGREDYLEDDRVRGIIGMLRFLSNPGDLPSLGVALQTLAECPRDLAEGVLAALRRADGPIERKIEIGMRDYESIPRLLQWAERLRRYAGRLTEKPHRLLGDLTAEIGADESESVRKFLAASAFFDGVDALLSAMALGGEQDISRAGSRGRYASGAVQLMTLHGSKGLEFPVVFLYGVERGTLPLEMPGREETDVEEERRLFYVGMTRARDELVMLASREQSPFLNEIPPGLLHRERVAAPAPTMKQMSLF